MARFYATKGKIGNRGDLHGEFCVHTSYSSTATLSAGDDVVACRLPAFCKVTEVVLIPGAAGVGNSVWKVGTSASTEQFLSSATYSGQIAAEATAKANAVGYYFSCSDEVAVRYEEILVTPSTAVTAGRWFDLFVKYVSMSPLDRP